MQDVPWEIVGEPPDSAIASLASLLLDCVDRGVELDIETPVTMVPATATANPELAIAT